MEKYLVILGVLIFVGLIGFFAHVAYYSIKTILLLITNKKDSKMKTGNILKQAVGFILTLITAVIGITEAPEMAISVAVFITSVVLIVEAFKLWGALSQFVQIVSWGTGIAFAFAFWWLGYGIFADIEWYIAAVYGFAATLAANGIADSEWLTNLIGLVLPKKK